MSNRDLHLRRHIVAWRSSPLDFFLVRQRLLEEPLRLVGIALTQGSRFIGGFIPDVVAACDQAVADGVDILSLSLGPNSPPGGSTSTFLNVLDIALLNAVKANVLVVQAAGNGGPYAKTVTSFSPWVLSVAAGQDDRTFPNTLTLKDKTIIRGIGIAPPTAGVALYPMVLAQDAVAGKGDPSLSPSDCQAPQLYNKALVRGKILICRYSFNYVFGGSTMQQLVITIKTLGAAGVAMVVDSDTSGGKFEPIPLAIPVIVFPTFVDSQFATKVWWDGGGREWAAARGSGTGVLGLHIPSKGRRVPKKRLAPDPSKAPKAKAAKMAKSDTKKGAAEGTGDKASRASGVNGEDSSVPGGGDVESNVTETVGGAGSGRKACIKKTKKKAPNSTPSTSPGGFGGLDLNIQQPSSPVPDGKGSKSGKKSSPGFGSAGALKSAAQKTEKEQLAKKGASQSEQATDSEAGAGPREALGISGGGSLVGRDANGGSTRGEAPGARGIDRNRSNEDDVTIMGVSGGRAMYQLHSC